jgi:ribosome-associated protein
VKKKAVKKTVSKQTVKKAIVKKKTVIKKTVKKTVKKAVSKKVAVKKAIKKPAIKKATVKKPPVEEAAKPALEKSPLYERIVASLDDDKAERIVGIDLGGRSSLCDFLVVATGRSSRHVAACAENLVTRLKEAGYPVRGADGVALGDWALVDAGDVIVHVFREEVRTYYDIEGMWSVPSPKKRE